MPMHRVMHERANSNRPSPLAPPPSSSSNAKRPTLPFRHSLGALPTHDCANRDVLEAYAIMRHSAPMLARSSGPKDVPETVLMRTDVRVIGVSKRDGHCVYELQVDTGFEVQVLYKRYSEIREFRAQLLQTIEGDKAHCGRGTCTHLQQLAQVKFPRRRLCLQRSHSLEVAQERIDLLERFIQAMLRVYRMASRRQVRACMNSNCVVASMIKDFVQVAEPVLSPASSDETLDGGLAVQAKVDLSPTNLAPAMQQDKCQPLNEVVLMLGVFFSIAEDPELLMVVSN